MEEVRGRERKTGRGMEREGEEDDKEQAPRDMQGSFGKAGLKRKGDIDGWMV